MHEIVDSTPAPDWAFVVPKILAISIVLFADARGQRAGGDRGAGAQGPLRLRARQVPRCGTCCRRRSTCVLFAVLAIFMQTLVPHKIVGWMLMLLFVVARSRSTGSASSTTCTSTPARPATPLSDMNGQGDFAALRLVVPRLLDAPRAVLLAVLAYALWRRGVGAPLKTRLARLPRELRGTPGLRRRGVAAVDDGRPRRLDLLQHQRPERLPTTPSRRAAPRPTTRRR